MLHLTQEFPKRPVFVLYDESWLILFLFHILKQKLYLSVGYHIVLPSSWYRHIQNTCQVNRSSAVFSHYLHIVDQILKNWDHQDSNTIAFRPACSMESEYLFHWKMMYITLSLKYLKKKKRTTRARAHLHIACQNNFL